MRLNVVYVECDMKLFFAHVSYVDVDELKKIKKKIKRFQTYINSVCSAAYIVYIKLMEFYIDVRSALSFFAVTYKREKQQIQCGHTCCAHTVPTCVLCMCGVECHTKILKRHRYAITSLFQHFYRQRLWENAQPLSRLLSSEIPHFMRKKINITLQRMPNVYDAHLDINYVDTLPLNNKNAFGSISWKKFLLFGTKYT